MILTMWKTVWSRRLPYKTGKVHATNLIKAIPEEHWENPDAVKQMEGLHEAILVKI